MTGHHESANLPQVAADSESWRFDLGEYIREGEPSQAQRARNWGIAIGLQAVDGLKTSEYLLETAKEHIEGRIDIAQAQQRVKSYYEERASRREIEQYHEADTVSGRISEMLGEQTFTFSPAELCNIHRRLFDGVVLRAGKYRTYNISKKEWVLRGDTVYYASCDAIAETLKYDFERELEFDYSGLGDAAFVRHIAGFVSGIWQIHPFPEGNTRTTAVFTIKYLRSMGYAVGNEPFEEHSWYFRNALVRANYENRGKGVYRDRRFLELFFENLLLGTYHELKNRYLHIDWDARQATTQENIQEKKATTQENNDTTQETTQERLLALLKKKPSITARQLSVELGISFDGVRYHLARLRKAGRVHHEGPTKSGKWVVHEQD